VTFYLKEHNINSANHFIAGWYIDTDVVDKLVSDFVSKKHLWVNKSDTFRGYSSLGSVIISQSVAKAYETELDTCISHYKVKYPDCIPKEGHAEWGLIEPYNVQCYDPGSYYSELHCENFGSSDNTAWRTLVFMTYLNDVEEGGETYFSAQDIKVKPEKGLTLIWPAYWTHMHKGMPALTEQKMITTGWLTYNNIFMI
jgi:hypothetical protein